MYKIQTLNKIAPDGLAQFPRGEYEIASEIINPDAIILRSADMHSMDIPASVKAVARAGAGTNNIPIPALTERGVVVFNTPGANANAVKELVIGALLFSSRPIIDANKWVKDLAGNGDQIPEMAEKGKLYLIPSPLGDNDPAEVIPQSVLDSLRGFRTFVVEEVRTARRYLSKAGLKGQIGELQFFELNEHTDAATIEGYLRLFDGGNDVALISEAGLPAVADPGAQLVALAHRHGIEVVPAVGPSSLMMALMASGLNGQSFAFCGYIPAKTDERRSRLKTLEKVSAQLKQTQILIETPYRNDSLFADILSVCGASTRVCVAANITMPDAYIKTKKVSEWKKEGLVIGKRPCVFLILA